MAPADLLFTGGRIWAGRGTDPVSAVAVAGGRVAALGDDALAARGAATEVVDLAGRTLLPGFRDGHLHPLAGGTETLDCDLVDATSVEEVQRRLRAFVTEQPAGERGWVLGYGYPPELLPGAVGRAATLDDVVADRPVALWSSDHHMVWVNTRALQVADIHAGTPDPPRGTIVRDGDGHPVGTLLEEAEHLLAPHLPPRDEAKEARGLEEGLARMAAAGLVWGQDAWSAPERLGSYQRVADAGRLTADLDIAWKLEPDRWQEQVVAFADARRELERGAERRRRDGVPGGRLTNRTVKVFVDGVIEGGTGAMLEPYCDHGALQHGGAPRGILNWERGDLYEAAAAMDAAGFELHMHAIGDAAVRLALDTVADVASRNGPRDRRPVVAHTHLVHPDDVPRFAQLGVIANLEPLWAQRNEIMVELTEPRLGPERSTWQYPIGSLLRAGAHVTFGSDWPVSSHVPLEGIAVAVTRETPEGEPPGGWLPDERIDLDTALHCYTAAPATQTFDEDDAGVIAVGQRADLVVVDADLATVSGRDLAGVGVDGTWRGGGEVHRR